MIRSDAISQVAEALAKAQAEFPKLPKDKVAKIESRTGSSYSYRYADLATILEAIRPPLAKHGLAVVQPVGSEQGLVRVTTLILHSSGEFLGCEVAIAYQGDIKALGSAITYARRYALTSMLGLAADEDDDAAAAERGGASRERPAAKPPAAPANPARPAPQQAAAPEPEAGDPKNAEKKAPGEVVAMIRAMQEQGLKDADKDLMLAICSSVVGREVTSRKELGPEEAVKIRKIVLAVTAAGVAHEIRHFGDFWTAYIGGALKEGLSILEPADIPKLVADYAALRKAAEGRPAA